MHDKRILTDYRVTLPQIVGLWLAEGSTRSTGEITFTNNQPHLIRFFHSTFLSALPIVNEPRIYAYLPPGQRYFKRPISGLKYKTYTHKRANRPFYIYRISGVRLVQDWRKLVKEVTRDKRNYRYILQGFFAGEGNVKFSQSTWCRTIRIFQKRPIPLIEKILQRSGIAFKYSANDGAYYISGRKNLEILWRMQIAILHPSKNKKFEEMLKTYQQYHYKRGILAQLVRQNLASPVTSKGLSVNLQRSHSRISQVLIQLERKNLVQKFKVRSTYYWFRTGDDTVIISRQKNRILKLLDEPKRVFEIAAASGKTWKPVFRRLQELERLGLVKNTTSGWSQVRTKKRVITK